MRKTMLVNVLFNLFLTVIFVTLNQWALQNHLEETFVALALSFGCIVIIGNALLISTLKTA